MNGERCPKCGLTRMPKIERGSVANARMCQNCGYLEELPPPEPNCTPS